MFLDFRLSLDLLQSWAELKNIEQKKEPLCCAPAQHLESFFTVSSVPLYQCKCFSYKAERLHWQGRDSVCLALALLDSKLVSGHMLRNCCHSARKEVICLLPSPNSKVSKYSIVLHEQLFPSFWYTVETVVSWVGHNDWISSKVFLGCPAQEGQEQYELQSSKKLTWKWAHFYVNRAKRGKQTRVSTLHSITSMPCCPRDSNTWIQIWLVTVNASWIYQNRNWCYFSFLTYLPQQCMENILSEII